MADERQRFKRLEVLCAELELLAGEELEARLGALEESEPELFPELRDLMANTPETAGLDGISGAAAELLRDTPTVGLQGAAERADGDSAGATVGRYRLERLLGVGGMGEVWAAQQSEPVSRLVALKLLRRGFATPARVARFEAERQALATMDHPNIARVFDGGETSDGQPYFVMELVEGGVPITTYCAHHELGLEARLRLFVPVCEAVDHAHRKRIIHRDLKPSNVLVTEDAGHPQVKVIDFGIAKPLEEQWASETHATVIGELVGTPEYMSPEQAALGAIDIDTRSDVFTLGLMLFELIVGDLPLSSKELRKLPFDELCRHIREDDTPLPSSLLRKAQQQEHPSTLSGTWRRVQGDLDRIVAKALAKDRNQRYGTAAELADDLVRFLEHEPVRATPPSGIYRMKKFVRRHRAGVAAGVFLVLGLVVGLAVAVVGFRQARAAEEEALANLAALESSEQFLVGLFQGATPGESLGQDPPASELLERGMQRLERLDDQPKVKARLLGNLGEVQRQRGEYDRSEKLHLQALELYGTVVDDPVQRAITQVKLGALYRRTGEIEKAEPLYREALAAFERRAPEHPSYGAALNELAMILNDSGRYEEAAVAYDQLIERLRADESAPELALPSVQFNAATNLSENGEPERALELMLEPLESFRRALPPKHPHFGTIHNAFAVWHRMAGRPACAQRHLALALRIDREVLPAGHPHLAEALLALSNQHVQLGEYEAARQALEEASAIVDASLAENAQRVHLVRLRRAILAMHEQDYERANALQGELVRSLEQQPSNPDRNRLRAALWRHQAIARRLRALELGLEGNVERSRALLDQAEQALDRADAAGRSEDAGGEAKAAVFQRALLEAQRGNGERAGELLREAEGGDAPARQAGEPHPMDDPDLLQFRAQLPALLGDAALAFEWAQAAARHPKRSRWVVEAPELQLLRGDPRFEQLEELLSRLLRGSSAECSGLPAIDVAQASTPAAASERRGEP